jgi:hypothetical protein
MEPMGPLAMKASKSRRQMLCRFANGCRLGPAALGADELGASGAGRRGVLA